MAKSGAMELIEFITGGGQTDGISTVLGNLTSETSFSSGRELGQAASELVAQLERLRSLGQTQVDTVSDNTSAVLQNTVTRAAEGGGALSSATNAARSIFGSGLGFSPLVSGLFHLFGGGKTEQPTSLTAYQRPASLQFDGLVVRNSKASNPDAMNITVQVNAMDSRSFLDHSDEIARAVREAMLHSNPLNDVVADL